MKLNWSNSHQLIGGENNNSCKTQFYIILTNLSSMERHWHWSNSEEPVGGEYQLWFLRADFPTVCFQMCNFDIGNEIQLTNTNTKTRKLSESVSGGNPFWWFLSNQRWEESNSTTATFCSELISLQMFQNISKRKKGQLLKWYSP